MTEAVFEETSGIERVARLPLAHLSIEIGHLYMEDFKGGRDRLRQLMEQVAPWERTARESCTRQIRPAAARISTCFLVDDYFTQFSSPREAVPQIIEAAAAAGMQVDYLAREAACVRADGVELARLVEGRLVPDPAPGTNGARPPVSSAGWLCNGERSPQQDLSEAMRTATPWRPPSENGANRHSIFLDVQLWEETEGGRLWSCPYLAAVWQLLRLGLLRHVGRQVAQPRVWEGEYPDLWSDLPPITQLTERPAAFSAFRTFSVLAGRFLPIEHAVRTILSQVDVGRALRVQMIERAAAERPKPLALPPEVIDRIEYVFAGTPWR
jgi:hypothetical protein